MPALRRRALPLTSKAAASSPERVMVLVPSASSVMTMSASLMGWDVSVFSTREVVSSVSSRVVGALLSVKWAEKGETTFSSV